MSRYDLAGIRAALRIDPLNTNARYNLAILLKDGGRLGAARLELKELLAADPGDTDAAGLLRALEPGR